MTATRAAVLRAAGRELAAAWPRGARVGESTVCSLCVHLLSAHDPDAVTVLADRDAGQTFYRRRAAGEVVHLDVFHAPGQVPPGSVAAAFGEALADYRADGGAPGPSPDWFDLQTAVGGGRVGGDLRGGRRPTVQAAHRGHVHLAGCLPPAEAAFCLYLVASVERAVAAAGLPPRKPLRVLSATAGPGAIGGLEDYAALTDTWLREPGGGASGAQALQEGLLAAGAQLADEFGGVEAVRALLEGLAAPGGAQSRPVGWSPSRLRDALGRLVQDGWAAGCGPGLCLTGRGQLLRHAFRTQLREIELALRAAARRLAGAAVAGPAAPGAPDGRRGRPRAGRGRPRERGEALAELAVAETALAAAARCLPCGLPLGVAAGDLRLRRRVRPRRVDLLLLLDASASMEGGRMRAAKTLARHLLVTGRDRVGVMAFQERGAALAVPLTRNFAGAERGLRQVVPGGLTPLAAGLAAARAYLRAAHARNPLLLLVTDGIPTVAGAGGSPLEEALEEAGRLQGSGIALSCIGLEPNERYLAELARRAGGRLHVVAELRPELLAAVARVERLRRMER